MHADEEQAADRDQLAEMADRARLREAEQRAADLATCEVLRALMAHYGGWERVPRKRRGSFADSTAEQVAEYIARIERALSQGEAETHVRQTGSSG